MTSSMWRSRAEEFSLRVSGASHQPEVQAFLILERVAGSKEFLVSVFLQLHGRFIGKAALGTVAEGHQILLSLRWDKPRRRFVASSQAAGSVPILSFIPFAPLGFANDFVPAEFSSATNFVLDSNVSSNALKNVRVGSHCCGKMNSVSKEGRHED